MNNSIVDYYKSLLSDEPKLSYGIIKLSTMLFFLQAHPSLSFVYLWFEPIDRLFSALCKVEGYQHCSQCFQIKPCTDFKRPLDIRNKCAACRKTNELRRREISRHWKAEKRQSEN